YSIQPATAPPGGAFEPASRGTEYFLSSLEFTGGLDNRIAVWALTNTSSLNSAAPALSLSNVVVDSEVYGLRFRRLNRPTARRRSATHSEKRSSSSSTPMMTG